MEEKKEIKRRARGKIAGRILATIMVVFMLLASCSTVIYYLVNNS